MWILLNDFQIGAHAGQRCSQLVCSIGNKATLLHESSLSTFQHPIESICQFSEFIWWSVGRQALMKSLRLNAPDQITQIAHRVQTSWRSSKRRAPQ